MSQNIISTSCAGYPFIDMNRKAFFARLAAVVAIVALAPEIAFGRKLERPSFPSMRETKCDICLDVVSGNTWIKTDGGWSRFDFNPDTAFVVTAIHGAPVIGST